jgi:hypothetical protein
LRGEEKQSEDRREKRNREGPLDMAAGSKQPGGYRPFPPSSSIIGDSRGKYNLCNIPDMTMIPRAI